jgi:hypothetical protein
VVSIQRTLQAFLQQRYLCPQLLYLRLVFILQSGNFIYPDAITQLAGIAINYLIPKNHSVAIDYLW